MAEGDGVKENINKLKTLLEQLDAVELRQQGRLGHHASQQFE